jgi:hypothetical protein
VRQDGCFVLLDPSWRPGSQGEQPPSEVVAGRWPLDAAGKPGPFQPNPDYLPGDEATPTDPADALLRLIMRGENVGEQLVPTVRDAVVEIAVDEHDQPLVTPASDGMLCVLVATAPAHRTGLPPDRWWKVAGTRLPEVVPEDVDILLNPDGPAPFRLSADALRDG